MTLDFNKVSEVSPKDFNKVEAEVSLNIRKLCGSITSKPKTLKVNGDMEKSYPATLPQLVRNVGAAYALDEHGVTTTKILPNGVALIQFKGRGIERNFAVNWASRRHLPGIVFVTEGGQIDEESNTRVESERARYNLVVSGRAVDITPEGIVLVVRDSITDDDERFTRSNMMSAAFDRYNTFADDEIADYDNQKRKFFWTWGTRFYFTREIRLIEMGLRPQIWVPATNTPSSANFDQLLEDGYNGIMNWLKGTEGAQKAERVPASRRLAAPRSVAEYLSGVTCNKGDGAQLIYHPNAVLAKIDES